MTRFPSHRDQLGSWLNINNLLGTGVEVGVARGDYARTILQQWEGRHLFLVDPWKPQDKNIYREQVNLDAPFTEWKCAVEALVKEYEGKTLVTMLPFLSVEAAKRFADGFLSFVYLDGNHSYEAVTEDLNAWWPKIRPGGIMGGHDFLNRTDNGWHCYVADAVIRWAFENQLEFTVTSCRSWWMEKPA